MRKLKKQKIFTVISFIFISFFCSYYFLRTGKLSIWTDGSFHFSRVEEIVSNIRSGSPFTYIATHTFNDIGNGNFLFYPTVFLYPWAFLRLFLGGVDAFWIWYGLFIFLTLIISYLCANKFFSQIRSYIFALIYTFVPYHLFLCLKNFTLGEFIAYTFIPIAFTGFYDVLKNKNWHLLAIGMTLLLYSHFITAYFTAIIIGLIFLVLIIGRKIHQKELIAFLKSIFVTVLMSSFILVPMLQNLITGRFATPQSKFDYQINMLTLIKESVGFHMGKTIGALLILTVFIGWAFILHNKLDTFCYILGIMFLIMATNIFPWSLIYENSVLFSILGKIQFPYRLLSFAAFFLCIPCSKICEKIIYKKHIYTILTILACLLYLWMTHPVMQYYSQSNLLKSNNNDLKTIKTNVLVNNRTYKNIFSYLVLYGETDYFPKQSFNENNIKINKNARSILKKQIFINGKTIKGEFSNYPNKIKINLNLNKKENVNLPVIAYYGTTVKVNGDNSKYSISNRGTVLLSLNKGNNTIDIQYGLVQINILLFIISLITWVILIINIIKSKK